MDNRFGIKDLALFVMMGAVVLVIVLAMKQFERQWDEMKGIREESKAQTSELASIDRTLKALRVTLASGPRIAPSSSTTLPAPAAAEIDLKNDPFVYVRLAQARP